MRVFCPLSILVCALAFAGCAAGETTSPDMGSSVDTAVAVDMASPPDGSSDTGATPDAASDMPAQVICTGGDRQCTGNTAQICDSTGTLWVDTVCAADQLCQDGMCFTPTPICTPNARTCSAWNVATICSMDGLMEFDESCTAGRCVNGACLTGAANGSPCTMGTECAGGACLCGDGSCTGTAFSGGFCTTSTCNVDGCAAGESCVSLPDIGYACLDDCSACTGMGLGCVALPSDGTWVDSCYLDSLAGVGAECAAPSGCSGGICLTESPTMNVIDNGYCAAPCVDDSGCPSNAECVQVAGYNGDMGFCALACVDDGNGTLLCPPERPNNFDLRCINRGRPEGGQASICFQP